MKTALQRHLVALAFSCLTLGAAAHADIIYVDDDAPPGGDGTSWPTAFNDLQLALGIAQEGDEIRVAQGIYKPAPPNGPRTATFNLVNGSILRGGYAGLGASDPDANDPVKFETLLSGDLNGDDGPNYQNYAENSYHIVTAIGVSDSTVLRGLSIVGGFANVAPPPLVHCGESSEPHSLGAGFVAIDSEFVMEDCVIAYNRAFCNGAGGVITGGAPMFIRCRFEWNRAQGAPSENYGGAIASSGDPTFVECEFTSNYSAWYGGGVYSGIFNSAVFRSCIFRDNNGSEAVGALSGANCIIVDCLFDQNSSGHGLAGLSCSDSFVINCKFIGNAGSSITLYKGAALRARGGTTVTNCYFAGNTGSVAPIAVEIGSSIFSGLTITGNASCCAGGIYVTETGELELANSVIWTNENEFGQTSPIENFGSITITNTCVQGWTGSLGGTGNHGNDPRFIDADGPDNIYGTEDDNPRLLANSPLINHGDNSALPPDTFDLDEDGDTTEPVPVDLDWLPRIVGETVDVGAYEFQGTPCLADVTGDSAVNVQDMLSVINAWGSCMSGQPCNADVTLDNAVNTSDLLWIINYWGACS